MAEFCGAYTLVDNNNMRDFAGIALASKIYRILLEKFVIFTLPSSDALAKIVFHTGIVACQVYDLLCKTLCQLVIVKEENSTFSWFLVFDQEPLKGNVKLGDLKVDPAGVNFRMKSIRIGEEFTLSVPITSEKAKSVIKRKSPSALEQTGTFKNSFHRNGYLTNSN